MPGRRYDNVAWLAFNGGSECLMAADTCKALGCSLEELNRWSGLDTPEGAIVRFPPDGAQAFVLDGRHWVTGKRHETVNARVWSADRIKAAKALGMIDVWREEDEGARIEAECERVAAAYRLLHEDDDDRIEQIEAEIERVDAIERARSS